MPAWPRRAVSWPWGEGADEDVSEEDMDNAAALSLDTLNGLLHSDLVGRI